MEGINHSETPINDDNYILSSENVSNSEVNDEGFDDNNISLPPRNVNDEKRLYELLNKFSSEEKSFSSDSNVICSLARPRKTSTTTAKRKTEIKFSNIASFEHFHVISNLIGAWPQTLTAAHGTGKQQSIVSADKIPYLKDNFCHSIYYMSGRIDLQGFDTQESAEERFERYALQIDSDHFATVHIEVGKQFKVEVIRRAFWNSVMKKNNFKLSESSDPPEKIPGDYVTYCSWKEK
jgi:hypothetical protein